MSSAKLLKKSELLSSLGIGDLNYIATHTEVNVFNPGEVVFHKGSAAIHFYIIKSGEVVITRESVDGEKYELAKYVAGDSFGEFDFITGSLHKVEARAGEKSVLLIFPSVPHTLDSISHDRADVISRLYLQSLSTLSSRLRSIHYLISENTTWVKALQEQIYIDQLTGLYTKAYLDAEIPKMLQPPVALLVIKPDKFKELNEVYGHQAGDAVIARIGAALLELTDNRPGWAIRLRSNEMAVLLQRYERSRALEIAKILALTITNIGPIWKNPPGRKKGSKDSIKWLTTSMALGMYTDPGQNWHTLFSTTYKLMQKAWKEGGHKIYSL